MPFDVCDLVDEQEIVSLAVTSSPSRPEMMIVAILKVLEVFTPVSAVLSMPFLCSAHGCSFSFPPERWRGVLSL